MIPYHLHITVTVVLVRCKLLSEFRIDTLDGYLAYPA